jgi:hypothetical protein
MSQKLEKSQILSGYYRFKEGLAGQGNRLGVESRYEPGLCLLWQVFLSRSQEEESYLRKEP